MSLPRYAAYKDSGVAWLGEVPAHWEVKSLKRAVLLQRGHDLPTEERIEGDVPIVSSGGISGYHNLAITASPTIVTGRYGTIGEFTYVEENCWPLNTALYTIEMYSNSPKYLWYMLQASKVHFILNSLKAAVPGVDRNDVHPVKITLPPHFEQVLIVSFLDHETGKIDALIAEQEKLLTLLVEKRQATISHAVTRGLNPDVPMKDSGVAWLGEVPAHWTLPPLYLRYSIELGKMLDSAKITGKNLISYLRNVDVQWGKINFEELPSMDIELSEYDRYTIQNGDLLVCEGGEVGRAAIVQDIVGIVGYQKALHRLRAIANDEHSSFMFYILYWAAKKGIFNGEGQATIAHLTGEQLRKYRFPKPPLLEQQAIVLFLNEETTKLDALKTEAERAVVLLKERRSALIAAAVTGQIDVRGANG